MSLCQCQHTTQPLRTKCTSGRENVKYRHLPVKLQRELCMMQFTHSYPLFCIFFLFIWIESFSTNLEEREEISKKKQLHENIKQIKYKFLSSVFYFPTGKTKSLFFLCHYSVRGLNPIYSLRRHSMAVLKLSRKKSVTYNSI